MAAAQGKFWEMHNILFDNRRNLGTTSLKLHSKEAGVTNQRILDDLVNATYGWQVQGDLREGMNSGVTSVPAFFVNGECLWQADFRSLSTVINAALQNPKENKRPGNGLKALAFQKA